MGRGRKPILEEVIQNSRLVKGKGLEANKLLDEIELRECQRDMEKILNEQSPFKELSKK